MAVHSSRLGPATGGTRMMAYPSHEDARSDAMRLAEAMTYKWAAADFPRGGGKAVIALPGEPLAPAARAGLLRRYGAFLRELSGRFWTGGDVGTSSADMDVIAETGAPYVFSRTPGRGGAGGSGSWTARGVFAAIETVCARLFGERSPRGRAVVVQGAGSVGAALIERLAAAGARVSWSDPSPDAAVRVARPELPRLPPERCLEAEADLVAPCALGRVLSAATIPRLRARAVVGAANDQLAAPEDGRLLRERGILYAPDFVVNAGGAVAITGIEALGWSVERAEREVDRIGETLARVLDEADRDGLTTDAAARRLAERRLQAGR